MDATSAAQKTSPPRFSRSSPPPRSIAVYRHRPAPRRPPRNTRVVVSHHTRGDDHDVSSPGRFQSIIWPLESVARSAGSSVNRAAAAAAVSRASRSAVKKKPTKRVCRPCLKLGASFANTRRGRLLRHRGGSRPRTRRRRRLRRTTREYVSASAPLRSVTTSRCSRRATEIDLVVREPVRFVAHDGETHGSTRRGETCESSLRNVASCPRNGSPCRRRRRRRQSPKTRAMYAIGFSDGGASRLSRRARQDANPSAPLPMDDVFGGSRRDGARRRRPVEATATGDARFYQR